MKPYFIRRATKEDAVSVAARLRKEDHEEIIANCGMDPRIALPLASLEEGRDFRTAGLLSNGIPECLFGVDPITENCGLIWFVSTDAIYDNPVNFMVVSKDLIDQYHSKYELLTNFVDARNKRHHKWLAYMGFRPLRTIEQFGAQSLPFIEFVSYRPCA